MRARRGSSSTALGFLLAVAACGGQSAQPERAGRDQKAAASPVAAVRINEQLVLEAAKVALPPPGVTPGTLPEPAAEGARSVVSFCTACHNLPTPTIHSATDWPSVVRRMWLRIDRLPPELQVPVPTPQQRQAILNYLVKNALVVSEAGLPPGSGRGSYAKVCSRCHALPDPRQHSPSDWPTVVARMQERMDQMKVDVPPEVTLREIRFYLDRVSAAPVVVKHAAR